MNEAVWSEPGQRPGWVVEVVVVVGRLVVETVVLDPPPTVVDVVGPQIMWNETITEAPSVSNW